MAVELPSPDEVLEFLSYVKDGVGIQTAAYAMNWTPRQLKKLMADDAFVEDIQRARDMTVEGYEEMAHKLAMLGNVEMLKLQLFNKAPDRWRPPTQNVKVEKTSVHQLEVVGPAAEVARRLLLEKGAVAAIHAGALEVEARDADDQ